MGAQKQPEAPDPVDIAKQMAKAGLGPRQFRSVIPKESFERLSKYNAYLADRLNEARSQRYSMVGTPAEIGARVSQRDALTAQAYGAGLPFGDEYSKATFLGAGGTSGAGGYSAADPYSQLRQQTQRIADIAQADAAIKTAEAAVEPPLIKASGVFEDYKTPKVEERVIDTVRRRRKRKRREEKEERREARRQKRQERKQRREDRRIAKKEGRASTRDIARDLISEVNEESQATGI